MPPRRSSRVASKAKAKSSDQSFEAPSSDYIADSDAASDLQDGSNIAPESQTSTPKGKRKSQKSSDPVLADESPNSKRLPVRIKDASSPPPIVDIEITIPAKKLSPTKSESSSPVKADSKAAGGEEADDKPKGLVTPALKKSGHIRFDNDDDDAAEKFYTPLEAPARNPLESSIPAPVQEEDEEESDDDAAPEAVSTSAAAMQTLKSAAAAAKVAEQQAASQKRKRQDRDALFKAQAKERKKARVSAPKTQDEEVLGRVSAGRHRTEKTQLPALLPAELLESDSSDDGDSADEEDDADMVGRHAKKARVSVAAREAMLARADRAPADRQVGSTLFRVMKERGGAGLAPQASRRSQDMRHDLLARRRVGKKMGGGFLVKGRS